MDSNSYLYTSRKIPLVSLSYKKEGKKGDSRYIIESEKTKRKNWWWPFLGKSKPKQAGGLKFGSLVLIFFSSLSILVVIQHYFMYYGQFLQKIRSTSRSPQISELVNQCPLLSFYLTHLFALSVVRLETTDLEAVLVPLGQG